MKKFLVIAFVLMLAFGAFAGDGKSMLDAMWFSDMIGVSYADQSAPGIATDASQYMNNSFHNKGWYHFINFFQYGFNKNLFEGNGIKVDASLYGNMQLRSQADVTGALGFLIADQFVTNISFGNIYTMGLGGKAYINTDIMNGGNFFTWNFTRLSFIFNNAITIAKIMNININAENVLNWDNQTNPKYATRDVLFLNASLSGSYDFGFSWSVGESVTLGFDLWKSEGWDATKWTNTILATDADHDDWRGLPYLQTSLSIGQDLLGPAGIKAVSLKLALDEVLVVNPPYAVGVANNTRVMTQGKYGLNLGVKEFSFGLFFLLATEDTINSAVDYNTKANYYSGPRPAGRGQAGLQVNFGFTKDFFSFGFSYDGLAQIRDFDVNGDKFFTAISASANSDKAGRIIEGPLFSGFYSYYQWMNQFDFSFTFNW